MGMQPLNYKDVEIGTIAINGVQMGVVELGKPTAATAKLRPTLVFIHGFTGNATSWGALLEHLAGQDMHVISLEMLGHGRSSAPEDPTRYSMEHCQQDILAALQALHIAPGAAILLGYSMGGRIALYTALSGYFRALVLESASPGLAIAEEREQRQRSDEALATCIEDYGLEAFVSYWESRPLFASQEKLSIAQRAKLREQRLHNTPRGLANSLRGVGTGIQPALHQRLNEITVPVLLITGQDDPKFCAIAREMATQLPQAQHQIVPNAGHTVHFEQPEAFETLVRNFTNSVQ
ncbi:putative 2-succinyl-6-hydroxy-2,4-cyclohexadiene-1-carboxylate synthase [Dictyobacter alpinus]|uniref:Putative 2-succinyl-6-hydroxy-2,4-cyclohexadiene-1-carboxylate synthase n=1 Tax=Dictyobacter alpinus TaxID=2014873 RepID=A0A402B2J5_9CHLR|nr:2-succinyl-6-hydroxy-2,4-cyclohexadiene-1-carboxylate synthase [Dictyobacter alpinus]GCE25571.1 putative 2-succinyl-6-hydroxy-2,4-cyclohexadiene-1-carboxylate synthase [Dictyobacter alpinus]